MGVVVFKRTGPTLTLCGVLLLLVRDRIFFVRITSGIDVFFRFYFHVIRVCIYEFERRFKESTYVLGRRIERSSINDRFRWSTNYRIRRFLVLYFFRYINAYFRLVYRFFRAERRQFRFQ